MIELDALSDLMLYSRKLKVSNNGKTDIVWSLIKTRVVIYAKSCFSYNRPCHGFRRHLDE